MPLGGYAYPGYYIINAEGVVAYALLFEDNDEVGAAPFVVHFGQIVFSSESVRRETGGSIPTLSDFPSTLRAATPARRTTSALRRGRAVGLGSCR